MNVYNNKNYHSIFGKGKNSQKSFLLSNMLLENAGKINHFMGKNVKECLAKRNKPWSARNFTIENGSLTNRSGHIDGSANDQWR